MQQHEIKTVTESEHFGQIIKDYYEKGHLFIKLPNNNLLIQFVKTSENDHIFFNVPNVKNLPQECLIVARRDNELVYGTMKQVEQNKNVFTFMPVKFQIIKLLRKDQRIDLNSGGKRIIFISSMISQIDLETNILAEKKKVEQVKNKITAELGKIFEKMKIFFIGEKQADTRFRYFLTNTNTIYIPDINNAPVDDASAEEQHKYYMENIYAADYQSKSSGFISEITPPLLYRKQMPYGYIQINSAQTLVSSTTLQLKAYASRIEQIFEKSEIFKPSAERFIVIDVSQGGFAIAFKDKKFLRLFQQNVSICVKMLLADKDIDMYAITRHITPDSRMITVGFQILTIEGRNVYDEFLKSLSPDYKDTRDEN